MSKRKLKQQGYKSFRLSKSIKHGQSALPSSLKLLKSAVSTLVEHKKFFGGVALVYGFLTLVFVSGFSSGFDVSGVKDSVSLSLGSEANNWTTSLSTFTNLASNNASTSKNDLASLYQTISVIICSLAIVWGLRQAHSKGKKTLHVKDGFYGGMYPLVPVLLVLLVVALQFLPLTIGASLYGVTIGSGLAVTGVEQLLWATFVILLAVLSLYMISSSIFALYIATLPGMKPMQALRSARKLVLHRRWVVMRKLVWLVIIILLALGFVVIPLIAFIPAIAGLVFFLVTIGILPLVHSYIYNLYRALL